MRVPHVLRHVAWVGAMALAAMLALPALDAIEAWSVRRANRPDPKPASTEQTRQIIAAVLRHAGYDGPPPPPPEPGDPPRTPLERVLRVSTSTLCLRMDRSDACSDAPIRDLRSNLPGAIASPKLREELILANAERGPLDLQHLDGVQPAQEHEIVNALPMSGRAGGDRARRRAAGWARVTRPVLGAGGGEALVYVEHRCGSVCGSGTLFRLLRVDAHWQVVDARIVWMS